ncbi:NAD(P)H-hydrate dehydratase [Stackebrandtia nassauensis]|uniref:ADP-dependent (S)-NAD(P)H-hydrate dehydratase n=1 Tax=Stackebrandtia nassauensis (strain DSM 44728 / CIP 108903 / NRRL B-16338 / NBRC 102104 / LLR-40K-21) TaxID=446470 RepID=D3QA13_STANL|nr:NAD(P)H-hydrate dehydratase [Stackebrandtia nassauensis]ADD40725.1 carbohydrate kinase, YjeF related protein [Stackebrandtia nassauensis DSM 44728]
MRGVWKVDQVRTAEAELMKRLPEGALMKRAAAGLAARCARLLHGIGLYGSAVTVLAGSGDNGGDALYAGALLARRGAAVTAVEIFPGRTHAAALAEFRAAGGRVTDTTPEHHDLVIDGILGIGGRPGLPDNAAIMLSRMGRVLTVAVDVPSGVDVDTGAAVAQAVRADVTVTFGCLKPALAVGAAAALAGIVDCVDIGLGPFLPEPYAKVPELSDVRSWWPHARPHDDKYTRGVLGVCAGSFRYPGAGELATAGALAGPAGYIRYAGTASRHIRYSYPEVVTKDRVADAGRVQAWTVGPGMGTDSQAASQLASAMAAPVPMCIDADALTLISDEPEALYERQSPSVITPHDREFSRLSGRTPGDDRAADALDLAQRLDCIVLLKGYRTIIANSNGDLYFNPTGDPSLATAGSGDVLAGLLGAMLAAGVPPERAAMSAAFLHGLAGREAANHGPVTASGIAKALPTAISRALGTAVT